MVLPGPVPDASDGLGQSTHHGIYTFVIKDRQRPHRREFRVNSCQCHLSCTRWTCSGKLPVPRAQTPQSAIRASTWTQIEAPHPDLATCTSESSASGHHRTPRSSTPDDSSHLPQHPATDAALPQVCPPTPPIPDLHMSALRACVAGAGRHLAQPALARHPRRPTASSPCPVRTRSGFCFWQSRRGSSLW